MTPLYFEIPLDRVFEINVHSPLHLASSRKESVVKNADTTLNFNSGHHPSCQIYFTLWKMISPFDSFRTLFAFDERGLAVNVARNKQFLMNRILYVLVIHSCLPFGQIILRQIQDRFPIFKHSYELYIFLIRGGTAGSACFVITIIYEKNFLGLMFTKYISLCISSICQQQ